MWRLLPAPGTTEGRRGTERTGLMEGGEYRALRRKKRRALCLLTALAILLLLVIIIVLLVVLFTPQEKFRRVFVGRCQQFQGYDCERLWTTFKGAFVGKDPCGVPMEAYAPLIAAAPVKPACNRMMFWTKSKDVAHEFTEKKDCFITLEDTMLGAVLDGLTWCGKENSDEVFTSGCPDWTDCENSPVRSFWSRASADYADAACGNTAVLLNGSVPVLFSPQSIFGSIEVVRLNATRVKSMTAVVVRSEGAVSNCTNPSLLDLQKSLDKGIKYNCTEVTQSDLLECGSDPDRPCGSCW